MYGLFGLSENVTNAYRLAAQTNSNLDVETIADLKPFLKTFLQSIQTTYPITRTGDLIVRDSSDARKLMKGFAASRINDLEQEKMIADVNDVDQNSIDRVMNALKRLKTNSAEVHELFNLVVHSLLLANAVKNKAGLGARGGTTSHCIGLIWMNLNSNVSTQDIVEVLIHEMTHTLVFLDELNNGHYDYEELSKRENWARSSILTRERPMDKVVHSIAVAHEILFARQNYLSGVPGEECVAHPKTDVLKQNTLDSIASVLSHPNRDVICKPRAIDIVENVRQNILAMN